MRTFIAFVLIAVLVILGSLWWLKFEHEAPTAALPSAFSVLGRNTPFDIGIDAGSGTLRQVAVRLRPAKGEKAGQTYELASESYPSTSWRGSDVSARQLHVETDLAQLGVPEGPAMLEVWVDTYAWHLWRSAPAPRLEAAINVDMTPPRVEILSSQHNIRLGGSDLAVFRQSADTVHSGVRVADYFFPSMTGYFADQTVALALFAAPQDLTGDIRFFVIATDAAGNERRVALPANVKRRKFEERTLVIDDGFLERKLPELIEANHLPASGTPVEQYLHVNRELRKQNEANIRELTMTSAPAPLWDGPFRRQPNAAPLSSFADRRTYKYKDDVIDHQTHLGFDLASLKLSPVLAAQTGVVIFADNLGIYGNAIILDHGLGIFSLYGHLSTMSVQKGDRVTVGQTIAQTGETGLAGGDHLHFSIMLYGVHIDPIEWWDPHWLTDHITSRVALLPRGAAPQAQGQP
jgi:murein DD-endopeptidase MepM/ murein hydrolase activator NlpD